MPSNTPDQLRQAADDYHKRWPIIDESELLRECLICGAAVNDVRKHEEWHAEDIGNRVAPIAQTEMSDFTEWYHLREGRYPIGLEPSEFIAAWCDFKAHYGR